MHYLIYGWYHVGNDLFTYSIHCKLFCSVKVVALATNYWVDLIEMFWMHMLIHSIHQKYSKTICCIYHKLVSSIVFRDPMSLPMGLISSYIFPTICFSCVLPIFKTVRISNVCLFESQKERHIHRFIMFILQSVIATYFHWKYFNMIISFIMFIVHIIIITLFISLFTLIFIQ